MLQQLISCFYSFTKKTNAIYLAQIAKTFLPKQKTHRILFLFLLKQSIRYHLCLLSELPEEQVVEKPQ